MRSNVTLEGAVDIHTHATPSLSERRGDGYEVASVAAHAGMDAVVIKHHYLPSVYGVPYIDRLLDRDDADIKVVGSVVLNYCNGGFNPFMVETAIELGAGVVWFPTLDARYHGEKCLGVGQSPGRDEPAELGPEYEGKPGLYALTEEDELTADTKLCIDKIVENDVLLAVGHLSFEETRRIVRYAADRGHDKIMVDHPTAYMTDFSLEQQHELVADGALMNYPFMQISPKTTAMNSSDFARCLRELGIKNCVVSTDVGQFGNPHSPDALELLGEILLDEGLSTSDFRTLVERNPKSLLGLE